MDKVQLEECPGCKSRLFGPVKFCPFCGKPVEEISPPSPLPPKGPVIKGLSISAPGESGRVVVTAVAHSEDGLNIARAEWWIEDDPGCGNGTPMEAVDGSFKSSRADITASIDISKFKPGKYPINVRSADVRNEWGNPQTTTLTVLTKEQPAGLYVNTFPSDAELTVDGTKVGRTPVSVENIALGKHSLTISKAGYENRDEQINIASGEKKSVEYKLTQIVVKQPTALYVKTSPSGAQLTIDETRVGTTPVSVENIAVGKHSLSISKMGYKDRNEQVDIASGEKKTVEYALTQIKRDGHLLRNAIVGVLIAACLFIGYKIISKPKEKAQLSVSTSPSGASLTIDGQSIGRTPKTGISVDSGSHHILVEKGSLRAEQDISVGPGEKKNLVVTLQKPRVDPAELRITTNPDKADVFVDDDRKGTTPLTLKNITPGEHSLTISKDGYEKRSEKFNIASGEKKTVEYALTRIPIPIKATLSVNTSPSGAQLILDGTRVGNTPASIENIAPGTHSLTISKAGYESRNEQLSIASGEKKTVEYTLTQITIPVEETATLYVNTSPPGAYLSVDGVRSGRTPVHLRKLSTGDHVLSVVMPGYESKEEIVSLSKGEKKVIRIILVEAARADPKKDIEDDLKEAIAAFNNSQYDVAIKMCQSVLRKDPNNSTAQQYLQKAKEEQERAINNLLKPGSVKRIK
jgi:hypothetical protein